MAEFRDHRIKYKTIKKGFIKKKSFEEIKKKEISTYRIDKFKYNYNYISTDDYVNSFYQIGTEDMIIELVKLLNEQFEEFSFSWTIS